MSERTFIIVGASLAGAKAAEELRERGFDGRVVLVGSEPARPYERPPLTKDYLRGESEREKAYVHDDGFYAQHEIELLTDTTATAIDPGASRITLDDGRELAGCCWPPAPSRRGSRFPVRASTASILCAPLPTVTCCVNDWSAAVESWSSVRAGSAAR
jgi:NADPH-dependent 2,4-dienoyl-CoA reductase/sulfur reductase-like enzyme